MAVDNAEIARLITRYADLLEIDGANPFRIRAYRNAVRFLAGTAHDMAKLVAEGRDLEELPGIGKILAGKITTIVTMGTLPQLTTLEEKVPAGLADLMELRGLGAKRVGELWHKLDVKSVADLERAIRSGTLAELPGFGAKTIQRLSGDLAARHHAGG